MILMELLIAPAALPYSAFGLGLLGLIVAVCGVFVKKDTPQTLCGLIGGLFLWTGWVEFLFRDCCTYYLSDLLHISLIISIFVLYLKAF